MHMPCTAREARCYRPGLNPGKEMDGLYFFSFLLMFISIIAFCLDSEVNLSENKKLKCMF